MPSPSARLLAAAGLRSLVVGAVGVLFGLYLAELRVSPEQAGVLIGVGLAGGAVGTAVVAFLGERLGRRATLVAATVLGAAGLAVVAVAQDMWVIGLAAFAGMVNGMGRDRGPAQTLEQSLLADAATDRSRTTLFTRYTLAQDVAGALGALGAGLPALLGRVSDLPVLAGYRWAFAAGAAISLAPLLLYAGLPPGRALAPAGSPWWKAPLSTTSKRRVRDLSGLFALDSLGGGFLAGSILTYWFFHRFGLGGEALGAVFFAARALNALSYLAAERLARRIGLVRTMVFTHLPSSLFLIALPFVPSAWMAVTLFLFREALVQMDVPTRQSYVAAVTAPGERTYALGVTGLVRNVGWSVGPPLAGLSMAALGLGAPLVLGAGLKIAYDLALYRSCANVPAPEEVGA